MSGQTLHRAFGYLLSRNTFDEGEWPLTDYIDGTGAYSTIDSYNIWFTTQGGWTFTEVNTGVVKHFGPGTYTDVTWTTTDGLTPGRWRIRADANTVTYCLDARNEVHNVGLDLSLITMFVLNAGQTRTLPQNTKLFLCDGTLDIDGTSYVGQRQLTFKTSAKLVTATTNCYGYIFP